MRHGTYTTVGTTTLQFRFADDQSQSIVFVFDDSERRMSVVHPASKPWTLRSSARELRCRYSADVGVAAAGAASLSVKTMHVPR